MSANKDPRRLPVYIDRRSSRWFADPLTGGRWFEVTPTGGGSVPNGSTAVAGILQLDDSVNSFSTTMAATPNAIRQAFSLAETANTVASTASSNATTALNNANSAIGTANTANSTASAASSTAGTALTTANNAVSTANSALSGLNSKLDLTGGTLTGPVVIGATGSLSFEGVVDDSYEIHIAVANPTADRTVTFPDVTGTIVTTGDSGSVTNSMLAGGITDDKLSTVGTPGKISNTATTATSANTTNAIVARDGSGNFSAGTITANLNGNASTVTTNANLSGDVTSVGNSTSISAGVIVNADVNANAAIAGTKVSPDFGSQNITTTGTETASSFNPTGASVPANGLYRPTTNVVAIATSSAERVRWGPSETVYNESGNDYDFRIEGDTNASLFFLDASADRIGIANASPASRLDLNGNFSQNVIAVPALNIDCAAGNYFTKTINGASTFTVSNVPASRAYSFTLELTVTSGSVTWFSGVEWPLSFPPALATGKTHLFVFVTDDGGTRWRASSLLAYAT